MAQARSCEFSQLLRPELGELRKGMLDRMPVADEETVRNRRARFRNDDVRRDYDKYFKDICEDTCEVYTYFK